MLAARHYEPMPTRKLNSGPQERNLKSQKAVSSDPIYCRSKLFARQNLLRASTERPPNWLLFRLSKLGPLITLILFQSAWFSQPGEVLPKETDSLGKARQSGENQGKDT